MSTGQIRCIPTDESIKPCITCFSNITFTFADMGILPSLNFRTDVKEKTTWLFTRPVRF